MELGSRSRIAPIAQSIYGRPRVVHFRRKLQLLPSLVCDDDVDPHFLRLGFNATNGSYNYNSVGHYPNAALFNLPPQKNSPVRGVT